MSSKATLQPPRALREHCPGAWAFPTALVLTAACLLAGQVLPGVTLEAVGRETEHYSVMGGVIDLWDLGHPLLSTVLFCFSIVFPTAKLLALGWIWWRPMDAQARANLGHWLKALGKWSMLDTFVVAALIGSVQLSKFITAAQAFAEPAVYFFATAILLSIALSFWIARLAQRAEPRPRAVPRLDLSLVVVPWVGAACLVAGLFEPLLLIEKDVFENVYALPESLVDLVAAGEPFLVTVVAVLVLLLPAVQFLGLGLLALLQLRGMNVDRPLRWWVALERWAMIDVYFLGLLLVHTRVSNIAAVTRPAGFWLVAGAAMASVYAAARINRRAAV